MSGRDDYVSLSIPKDLITQAQKYVGKHGYESVTEIAKEALRFRLEELAAFQRRLRSCR